ncbi:hypothetical protein QEG73_25530, partial [Chitinophagaceae bacterium 26-R-25]|nr:hypothetical protein [Chitinophagaceae bacterium 26-R-25]
MMKKIYSVAILMIVFNKGYSQVWGDSSRTEIRNDAGLQGNAGAKSGFFQTINPINYPKPALAWWHLLDVRHSNPVNNFAMQFAGEFFDQDLYFRKVDNNPAQPW